MRSGNPVLNDRAFERGGKAYGHATMTLDGTVNKAFILLVILSAGAMVTWNRYFEGQEVFPLAIGSAIVGLVLALIIAFAHRTAPFLAPVYAAAEGIFVGGLSAHYESLYRGITLQAVLLTVAVFVALLLAYKTRLIRATQNFKLGVFAATAGIFIMYLLSFVLGLFGVAVPFLHENGWVGIGISLFIVVIAALNLVLDFDFIESGARNGLPKHMEWYGAFGLVVTLIWLYLEILRLLAKLRSRD
ncbi:Bax inhibitor-1/YccA family protein [Paenibacillus antri]